MKEIHQRLLAIFQTEHREHVEQIRAFLAATASDGGPPPGNGLEDAFRRAHSLKGAARAVDLNAVEGLAHRLETLFSRVRQGVVLLDKHVTAVAEQVLDASEDCVTGLGDKRPAAALGPALLAIDRVLGADPETAAAMPPPETTSVPAFESLDTVRVGARNFDGLLRSAGGLLTETLRQNQVTDHLSAISSQLALMVRETESAHRAARQMGAGREFLRVSAFLQTTKKHVRSLSRQAAAAGRLQRRSTWTILNLGRQLERDVWQARMLPAEVLFEGYRKMVRDLARDESREIEFRAVSNGVHADRRVLESLKDPVMHLLRNTVSHGIETPRERLAKAKPAMGLVTLRIETEGQRLTVLVEDDGRGVDFARVAEVAVQRGILSQAEAAQRSPEELSRMLFQAGFSTTGSVTNLAGRGMGLSVVYEAVRRLQGEVDFLPAPGCGTRFRISVPLSISTHRLLLVRSGSQRFAIPIQSIERLHRVKPAGVEAVEGKPVIVLDRGLVPLYSMHHLVHREESPTGPHPSSHKSASGRLDALQVMILISAGKRAAVTVDAFLRETEAVILDLGPAAARNGKVSGGIILEDGSVAFVLNIQELLETSVHRELENLLPGREPAPAKATISILVVDDSLTTRTLEKSILEAHGYRVRVAVDGIDAIEKLRAEKVDVVISDIQMPRLDGFGLLQALKKDADLGGIPVIMVTSVERAEDQERGLSLGAGAWIVKRKFDQAELLSAIQQLV